MATETAHTPQLFRVASIPVVHPLPPLTAQFVVGEHLMTMFGRIEPDASLPLHSHPHEQITYVTAGSVHFQVDGVGHDLVTGDGLVIPGGITHGAVQVGPEGCDIIEIFTPLRAEYVALMQAATAGD